MITPVVNEAGVRYYEVHDSAGKLRGRVFDTLYSPRPYEAFVEHPSHEAEYVMTLEDGEMFILAFFRKVETENAAAAEAQAEQDALAGESAYIAERQAEDYADWQAEQDEA
jgi:hypothetical protein